jgi:oligoribonuclease NrnB/cAMP/cGMP phosphodiesterase (DHH superfamily)
LKRFIIYHDDADGRCAAAIAGRDHAASDFLGHTVAYLPIQYDDPVPWEAIDALHKDLDELWILDFSFPKDVMCKIRQTVGQYVVWIDHHKTAIEALDNCRKWPGVREDGTAACILTWRWLNPKKQVPLAVRYLGDRDVWRFEFGDLTRWFYEIYLRSATHPESALWDTWLQPDAYTNGYFGQLLKDGRILYEARMQSLERIARRFGREENRLNLNCRVLTINFPGRGELGQVIRDLGYDVAHCYHEEMRGGHLVRINNLYGNGKVDVGEACQAKGGGGHARAAGFVEALL